MEALFGCSSRAENSLCGPAEGLIYKTSRFIKNTHPFHIYTALDHTPPEQTDPTCMYQPQKSTVSQRQKQVVRAAWPGHKQQQNKTTIVLPASAERTGLTPSCLTEAAAFGESVSLRTTCDFFNNKSSSLQSRGRRSRMVTMAIYYQSGRGVSEYRGHKHNRPAVTGHSTQSAR